MHPSRRDFLAGLGAAGLVVAVPRAAHAGFRSNLLYPPINLAAFDAPVPRGETAIRPGCAAITWNGKDTQAIEDIAALGYAGIQLRANAVDEFPDPQSPAGMRTSTRAFASRSLKATSRTPSICARRAVFICN
jgi:hypothetical protein